MARAIIERLAANGMTVADLASADRASPFVPIAAFRSDLTPLETIVKFLREERGMRLVDIAAVVGRDQRAIGVTYARVARKMPGPLPGGSSHVLFPAVLLRDEALTPAEHVVRFLRDAGFSHAEIARMLGRDGRTVWTLDARSHAARPSTARSAR